MKNFAIGCGVVLVVLLGLGALGVYQFKNWMQSKMPDMERFGERRTELVERYGDVRDYVPPVDGRYDPARVATFVEVRESLTARGEPLVADVDALIEESLQGGGGGLRGFIGGISRAVNMLGDVLQYGAYADSVLMAHEMGRGEFTHYHLVLLFGWYDLEQARRDWGRQLQPDPEREADALEAAREMFDTFAKEAEEILEAHLRNLRAAAADAADDSTRAYLELVETVADQLPFTAPVPPTLDAAFEAHRVVLFETMPRTPGAWIVQGGPVFDDGEQGNGGRSVSFRF